MTTTLDAAAAIGQVCQTLTALPACIAGSAVASEHYGLPTSDFTDVDVFCFSKEALMVGVQQLLAAGYTIEERHTRVWQRWLKYGLAGWHTNSIKLKDPNGTEINLIYKLTAKHPLVTLSQVLESFDFGLLGIGYDLELGTKHDLRAYLFPGMDPEGPLPLMPQRRDAWRGGFISQYQGLRELGRYAKYDRRGFDMSLVKDDLIEGYMAAALYNSNRIEVEKLTLSKIYYRAAELIDTDDFDALEEAGKAMVSLDSLDLIMEELE